MPDEIDRYPVPVLGGGPAAFKDELRALWRAIRELQSARPLGNTTLAEGTLIVVDDDGNVLVEVGKLDGTPERYGLRVNSPTGVLLFQAGTDGYREPRLAGEPRDPVATKSTTSATFDSLYAVVLPLATHGGCELWIPWATGAATTGEIQLTVAGGGTSDAFTLPAGSGGSFYVRWLHGIDIGDGPVSIGVDARRTSGAGSVFLAEPVGWTFREDLCTAGGDRIDV